MTKIVYPFVRSAYNYDRDAASVDSGLECLDESRAIQAHAADADINNIVRRFGLTGHLPEGSVRQPLYGDFTEVTDYRSALDAVMAAEAAFMQMPAELRQRCGNDPQRFMDYCLDPANLDELRKYGLAVPPATPPEVRTVPPVKPSKPPQAAGAPPKGASPQVDIED